jgi:hypothetical protein
MEVLMPKTKIQIICAKCGKKVRKLAKSIKLGKKRGQTKFYCSKSCSPKSNLFTTENNPNKLDEYSIFRYHLKGIKDRSKKKKIESYVTLDDLKDLWEEQNGLCAVTKLKLVTKVRSEKRLDNPYQASVDRIDNSKGYSKDNCRWVCLMFNYARNTFSDKQVLDFIFKASSNIQE